MAVWISVGLVFLGALVLYARTLAPTVTLVDSGELIVAAHSLGVAHPPGFPLYVMLAHLATLVPLGNVAQRVNFASAFFAALSAGGLVLVVAEMTRTSPVLGGYRGKMERRAAVADPPLSSLIPCLAPAAAGLSFACSRTVWAYATVAEVYTLNTLLIVIVMLLVLRWRRARLSAGDGATDRWLYGAAFVFGLALGVHHVTVGLVLPALALLVLTTTGMRFFTSRTVLWVALSVFVGLTVYAYLPWSASRSPLMNWGDPRTLERLWWHVSGRQYRVFFTSSAEIMVKQVGDFLMLATREFGPWWLPIGLIAGAAGLLALLKRDRALAWFLLLIVLADVAYGAGYEIAEDKDAYYLPSFVAIAIAAGVGLTSVARRLVQVIRPARLTHVTVVGLLLLVPLTALAGNLPYNDRRRHFIARDYAENVLSTIGPGGMLLTRDWQVYSPMLYLQEIERRRTDVITIDVLHLRRSWYFDYLRRAHPQLLEGARDKVDPFLEDLKRWEGDPERFGRDPALTRRINTRFYDMILAFVSRHLARGPVHVTQDVALNREDRDQELTTALTTSYQLVPQGLTFQLFSDRQFHEPSALALETRGLADGSITLDDTDVAQVKVLPVYVIMLVNRGRYLASHGRHEPAMEAYRHALALGPDSTVARQSLAESQRALGERRD